MTSPRCDMRVRDTAAARPEGKATSACAAATPNSGSGKPRDAPGRGGTRNGARHGRAGRGAPEGREGALRGLLRGLRAGDLEGVLLTVAMAAEENRMPSADPDEAQRILAFLARLAEHDAALPPPDDASAEDAAPGTG
jgi:hypothetical protein